MAVKPSPNKEKPKKKPKTNWKKDHEATFKTSDQDDKFYPEGKIDSRTGRERKKRFVTLVHVEKYWVEQARKYPDFFMYYISGMKPAEHHKMWLAKIFGPSYDRINLIGPRESGKALENSEPVLTPFGWKPIGDIQVGDLVAAPDGSFTEVVGVYPQGDQDIYEVTFTDGSSVRSTDDHLWYVRLIGAKDGDKYRTLTLNHIRTKRWDAKQRDYTESELETPWLDYRGYPRFHIPIMQPIQHPDKEYFIHPYIMGALLGDGGLSGGQVMFTSADSEILEKIVQHLPNNYQLTHSTNYDYRVTMIAREYKGHEPNGLNAELIRLGLKGTRSGTKFIPQEYLLGSIEQRIQLLQGLFDTNGWMKRNGVNPVFTTVSEHLANDVRQLVWSLGGSCTKSQKPSGYRDKDGNYVKCKDQYNLHIKFSDPDIAPFYISRKAKNYHPATKYKPTRGISNIRYVGSSEATCIKVAHPSELFVTKDYIVTHNTTTLVSALAYAIGKQPLKTHGIISVSSDQSKARIRVIKDMIQDNERYRNVFPDVFIDPKMPNTSTEFTVYSTRGGIPYNSWKSLRLRYSDPKDVTLFAAGVGGKGAIGKRISGLLLLDDLINEDYLTDAMQDKVEQYVMQTLEPTLKESAKMVNIGTRWMTNDLPERLQKNPAWHTVVIPAIRTDDEGNEFSYWEDYWPLEKLYDKKRKMNNDALFDIMFMNDPRAMMTRIFTLESISQSLPFPLPKMRYIYIGVDLAISERTSADYTVFSLIGIDEANNMYILDMERFRANIEDSPVKLEHFYQKALASYGTIHGIIVEKVGFQAAFAQIAESRFPHLPLISYPPKGDKVHRAQIVATTAKRGQLFVDTSAHWYDIFKTEALNFAPQMKLKDDTIDAVSIVAQYCFSGVTASQTTVFNISEMRKLNNQDHRFRRT